jgi:FtsP/CotA-like multicopper oxidase with cupredoxin domain
MYRYEVWPFNSHVPGPFVRVREGDVLELTITNKDPSGMLHNVDFHAATGPGGGSVLTTVEKDQTKTAWFRMLNPGLCIF